MAKKVAISDFLWEFRTLNPALREFRRYMPRSPEPSLAFRNSGVFSGLSASLPSPRGRLTELLLFRFRNPLCAPRHSLSRFTRKGPQERHLPPSSSSMSATSFRLTPFVAVPSRTAATVPENRRISAFLYQEGCGNVSC